jgi:hypothetical protein
MDPYVLLWFRFSSMSLRPNSRRNSRSLSPKAKRTKSNSRSRSPHSPQHAPRHAPQNSANADAPQNPVNSAHQKPVNSAQNPVNTDQNTINTNPTDADQKSVNTDRKGTLETLEDWEESLLKLATVDLEKVNWDNYAKTLINDSVVVIPFLNENELKTCQEMFRKSVSSFPEYKDPSNADHLVEGGFAALGNPSSFHCLFARLMRLHVQKFATHLFKALNQLESQTDRKLEQLVDRLMSRHPTKTPGAESWHRDLAPFPKDGKSDVAFGGWINLDNTDQYFSCCKGTHKDAHDGKGFSKINKTQHAKYDKLKSLVVVPMGHWIVFYQHIVHEVVARKRTTRSCRQFTGFRLTKLSDPLFPSNAQTLSDQGVPKIPSGQTPPMYSANHWSFPKNRKTLIIWAKSTFIPKLISTKTVQTTGESVQCIERFLPSLKTLNLPLYQPYQSKELKILTPTTI